MSTSFCSEDELQFLWATHRYRHTLEQVNNATNSKAFTHTNLQLFCVPVHCPRFHLIIRPSIQTFSSFQVQMNQLLHTNGYQLLQQLKYISLNQPFNLQSAKSEMLAVKLSSIIVVEKNIATPLQNYHLKLAVTVFRESTHS